MALSLHDVRKPPALAAFAVSASMIAMSAAVLLSLYLPHRWPGAAAMAAFAAFAIFGQQFFGRREKFLLGLALALTAAAWLRDPDATGLTFAALERAAFLAAFMILLALLRDGAATSPAVLQVGTYLTRQPPSRRYLSIHFGGHVLSLLLNFGALNLLGPLIMRGIAASTADPRVAAIRQQRQISALIRGFSLMVVWSPTAITQALIFAIIPGAEHGRMILLGLFVVLLTSLAGWGFDWLSGLRARRVIPPSARPQFAAGEPFPARAFRDFAAVCALLAAATVAIMLVAGVTTVPALMLAAPIITASWLVRQYADGPDRPSRLAERAGEIAGRSVPLGAPEAMTLSCAGYCGIVAAGLVDPHWFSDTLSLARWPEYGFYAAAMLLPPLLSNFGLPPMLTTTFLGTLLSGLPGLEFDPTLLAMAFCVGWSLNLTVSPLGLSAIILSRITGTPGRVLAWQWNGAYSLAVAFLTAGVLIAFSKP